MSTLEGTPPPPEPGKPERAPGATIRLRYGRKTLRHGMRLGWRVSDGQQYPVTVTRRGGDVG